MKKNPYLKFKVTFTVMCCMLTFYSVKAQYITLTDPYFKSWFINNGYGSCLNGDQLDTTCPALNTITSVNCSGYGVVNLYGIQYLHNLRSLNCANNMLDSLPILPDSLRYLNCSGPFYFFNISKLPAYLDSLAIYSAGLLVLPPLPATLRYLVCYENRLTALPTLPAPLQVLWANNNSISSLPSTFPSGITSITLSYNQLTSLPPLPDSLQLLNCDHNLLTSLPAMPSGVFQLECGYNPITSLPAMSPVLQLLGCDSMDITSLPALPASLIQLNCSYNHLTNLPASTPNTLLYLECTNNQLTSLAPVDSVCSLYCSHNQLTSLPYIVGDDEHFTGAYGNLDCSYNQITALNNIRSYQMGELLCNNNPNLACLSYLPAIQYFRFDSTAITCLPNYPAVDSSKPALDTVPLCLAGNAGGCPPYQFVADAGPPFVAFCAATTYVQLSGSIRSGYPPYTVSWAPSAGLNKADTIAPHASPHASTLYYLTVTDSIGTQSVDSIWVILDSLRIDSSTMVTSGCSNHITGSACVYASHGFVPYSYFWYPDDSTFTTPCRSSIDSGSHYATVTDSIGCHVYNLLSVTPLKISSIVPSYQCGTNSACANSTGGSTPITFIWSDTHIGMCDTGLTAGIYTVTALDAGGCSATATVTIAPPSPLAQTDSVVSASCSGVFNGAIFVSATGGATPLSYSLNGSFTQASNVFTGLIAGDYVIQVIDHSGCTDTAIRTINDSSVLTGTIVNQLCFGNLNDTITSSVSGGYPPYQYSVNGITWQPSNIFTSLQAGIYTVDVKDYRGCTLFIADTILQVNGLTDSVALTDVSCFGNNDGGICLYVSGGTPGYIYTWLPVNPALSCISGLIAGTYSVTVTDSFGCSLTTSQVINQPAQLSANILSTDSNLHFGQTDTLIAITTGGTSTYNYVWNDSTFTSSFIVNQCDTYSVIVTDGNNCKDTAMYVLTGCSFDSVWPGDANYDGIVNNIDLLPIGLAYGDTGFARANATINWVGQYCENWLLYQTDSANYKHIDCDGNGIINADDTVAIIQNYSLIHTRDGGYVPARGNNIVLLPKVVEDTVYNSNVLTIQLILGDSTVSANNVYAIAFTLNYDPSVVDTSQTSTDFANSWLGTSTNKISITKDVRLNGQLQCALTRIDHTTKSGEGSIGLASFVITTDNLNGKDYAYYNAMFYISNTIMIDSAGNILPLDGGIDSTQVAFTPASVQSINGINSLIHIYPNPANGKVAIFSNGLIITQIKITDVLGNSVLNNVYSPLANVTQQQLDIAGLASGIYMVEVITNKGVSTQKLIVTR